MEGDANGAPHPEPAAYAKMFSGKYSHRTIKGGIGHNLPQEAPRAFAEAIIDVVAGKLIGVGPGPAGWPVAARRLPRSRKWRTKMRKVVTIAALIAIILVTLIQFVHLTP